MSRGQRAATVKVRENTLASQNNTFDFSTKAPKNGQKRKKKGKKYVREFSYFELAERKQAIYRTRRCPLPIARSHLRFHHLL